VHFVSLHVRLHALEYLSFLLHTLNSEVFPALQRTKRMWETTEAQAFGDTNSKQETIFPFAPPPALASCGDFGDLLNSNRQRQATMPVPFVCLGLIQIQTCHKM
jgi:hypothetical protein